MQIGNKEIVVVGDRVLIKPDNSEDRTKVGLYLPQTVIEKQPVHSGFIVETGPGIAIPNFQAQTDEPWKKAESSLVRFLPVQAEAGDYALFLRKEAIEIRYQNEEFLLVPQSALLLVIRGDGVT